jgi:hypothetical protein
MIIMIMIESESSPQSNVPTLMAKHVIAFIDLILSYWKYWHSCPTAVFEPVLPASSYFFCSCTNHYAKRGLKLISDFGQIRFSSTLASNEIAEIPNSNQSQNTIRGCKSDK